MRIGFYSTNHRLRYISSVDKSVCVSLIKINICQNLPFAIYLSWQLPFPRIFFHSQQTTASIPATTFQFRLYQHVEGPMWYVMAKAQSSYQLSERLIRAISNWQTTLTGTDDDIEALLDAGADVNRLHGTLLPLHCACMVGDAECAELLIQRGAQVNAIDGYGRAALHFAAEKDVECVELLLSQGCDPDIQDANGDTPLHWAAFKNNVHCVQSLLQQGAEVNAVDFNNNTPLSWAAMKGNLEAIKILLEYNARVDLVNFDGLSPLVRAAFIPATGLNTDRDDACLELLIKANGQFDLRNTRGQLPNPIASDNRLSETLLSYCVTPRSLQDLCRYTVREKLGSCHLPSVVLHLPIPARLQEVLLLQR